MLNTQVERVLAGIYVQAIAANISPWDFGWATASTDVASAVYVW